MSNTNLSLRHDHKYFFQCEYCKRKCTENVFKVTRNSEFVWKLIHIKNPISQHLEPKLCCEKCYLDKLNLIQPHTKGPVHYQVIPNHQLREINPNTQNFHIHPIMRLNHQLKQNNPKL